MSVRFMLKSIATVLLILAVVSVAPAQRKDKNNESNERSVSGTVTDSSGAPLKGAVVQLENTKTLQIRSFIAKDGGEYFFNGLSTDVDYQLSAEMAGHRSGTKVLSSFDSRREAHMDLQIRMK
jgi:hypothetical protein